MSSLSRLGSSSLSLSLSLQAIHFIICSPSSFRSFLSSLLASTTTTTSSVRPLLCLITVSHLFIICHLVSFVHSFVRLLSLHLLFVGLLSPSLSSSPRLLALNKSVSLSLYLQFCSVCMCVKLENCRISRRTLFSSLSVGTVVHRQIVLCQCLCLPLVPCLFRFTPHQSHL